MDSITLDEQKREKVPRISGEEALILLGLAKARITTKTNVVNICLKYHFTNLCILNFPQLR